METKILELIRLCLQVNKTKATAFLSFSGHVDHIDVDICTNGYSENIHADYSKYFCTDERFNSHGTTVDEIIDDLKEMLEVD